MTNWRSYGRLDPGTWYDELRARESPLLSEWDRMLAAAGDHSALMAALCGQESDYGRNYARNRAENRNPLNLKRRGVNEFQRFASFSDCAAEWRSRVTDPAYAYARTTDLRSFVDVYAPGNDANDPAGYTAGVLARFARWGITGEPTPVTIKAQECPIEIWVLEGNAPNRPALPMPDASNVTVHEVGNTAPGADEDMHARFVHNGGGENAVSFHFVCGPTKIVQLIYLNENAWHASDGYYGAGNRDSIAIETIQVGNFGLTMNHLAWLIAEIFRNPRRFKFRTDVGIVDDLDPRLVKERVKQHNSWAPDHKNCPQFMRERGLWVPLLNAAAAELVPGTGTKYTSPVLPDWWTAKAIESGSDRVVNGVRWRFIARDFHAIAPAKVRSAPAPNAPYSRPPLKIGETVDGRYLTDDGWLISRYGSAIRASSLDPGITFRRRQPKAA